MDLKLQEKIAGKILLIRGERVMLDRDLAELYGVTTANLNKAVEKNIKRFPENSIFYLTRQEIRDLSQFVESLDNNVSAFTEQGIDMLSSILKSERAVQVSIEINWILSCKEFDKYPDLVEFAREYSKHKKHLLVINYNHYEGNLTCHSLGEFIRDKYSEKNLQEGSDASISKFGYSELARKLIDAESKKDVEQMVSIWFRHGFHVWIDFAKRTNEKIMSEFTDHLSMDDYRGTKGYIFLMDLSRLHYGLLESFVSKLLHNEKTFIIASMKPGESQASLPPSFLNFFKVFDLGTGKMADEAKPSSETKDNSRLIFNDKGHTVTIDKEEYEFVNKGREYKFLKILYDNLDEYIIDDDLGGAIGLDFEKDDFTVILLKTKSRLMKTLITHKISILRRIKKGSIDGAYKLVFL